MTQEDKQLLFKDLCARLPYEVKVFNTAEEMNKICEFDSIMTSRKRKNEIFVSLTLPDDLIMTGIENIKPYLRSMSSMTKGEKQSYYKLMDNLHFANGSFYSPDIKDWLDERFFDYRGLIEKGLALEAPEGMYKTE